MLAAGHRHRHVIEPETQTNRGQDGAEPPRLHGTAAAWIVTALAALSPAAVGLFRARQREAVGDCVFEGKVLASCLCARRWPGLLSPARPPGSPTSGPGRALHLALLVGIKSPEAYRLIHYCRYVSAYLEHWRFKMEPMASLVRQLQGRDRTFFIDMSPRDCLIASEPP